MAAVVVVVVSVFTVFPTNELEWKRYHKLRIQLQFFLKLEEKREKSEEKIIKNIGKIT